MNLKSDDIIFAQLYMKAAVYSLDGAEALIENMQASLVPNEEWDNMVRRGVLYCSGWQLDYIFH